MILASFCKSDEFCICCYENGGVYDAPLSYYCNTELCGYPGKMCLFVQKGGKRP